MVARIVTVVSSAGTPCCVVPRGGLGATCGYGAYVRPMLIHVRLLEAMLGPCSSHAALMLGQERRVPFEPLPDPAQKEHAAFRSCRDQVVRIQSLCSAYVDPC